ncbi:MAG: putative Hybrid sensor histidine kinase, partial [Nitrospira sp.]|nr:putative Hybrid sensor histidine kinase [Nitrospira sp.]
MSVRPIHILLVEDHAGDARLLRELLSEADAERFTLVHVDRLDTGIRYLNLKAVDIILLDLSLPDSHGSETLARMHAAAKGVPIVLMTGLEDEELGLRLVQAGAQDYLVKGQVTAPLLTRALKYAVERKRLEEELRRQTHFLQSVLNSMADGVVMADEKGVFQVWNPAAERIMGTGPTNVGIDQWPKHYGLFLPDTVTPYQATDLPLARAIRGECLTNVLMFFHHPDRPGGAWLSVTARPLRDEIGQLKGGVAVFRDITGSKRTDEALCESQERYRLLVTKANDIIYRTDAMGRFTFVNPVAMRIMKYSEEELLERRFVDLIHPAYRQAAERFYGRQFIKHQSSTYYEFLALAKDGSEIWIGQNVQVLLEHNKVVGFQAVARDITERKHVQDALAASEERFRSLVSNLPGAVYRCACDSDWTMEFLSEPIEHLCGYPASDFLVNRVRSYASVIDPSDRHMIERAVLDAVAQRRPFAIEYRMLHKDGSLRWVHEKGQGVFAPDGRLLWLDGAIFDITEQKRAEEALSESEGRLRSIVQSTGDAIILMDARGQVAFWNSGAEKTFGFSSEEMLGQPVAHIIPQRFREAHQRGVERVAAAGRLTAQATMFELIGLRKDGTEFPLEFSLAAWTTQSKLFITGIIRDITERTQAESAFRESEERFRTIMDNSPALIFIKDMEGRYLQINRRCETIFHLSNKEVLGKTDDDLFPPEQAAPFRANDQKVLDTGTPMEFEETALYDDGLHTNLVVKFPLFNSQGQCYALCGIATDITDRKRADEERQQLAKDRLLLLESTGEGIYGMDRQGRCTFINTAAARMLGYMLDDVLGKDMHDLIHHSFPDGTAYPRKRCHIYETVTSGSGCQVDDEVYWRKDGTSFPVEYSSFPVLEQERITGAVVIFLDITQRKQAEAHLRASHTQLRNLTARLESVREEERILIAREIHDELGQSLTGVKLELSLLRDQLPEARPALASRLEAISTLIDTTIQSVRRIATELRPIVLDQLGLIPAIEWQAHEFQSRTGIQCTLDICLRSVTLSHAESTAMFRIFQEILTNVARHAQATTVNITLQEQA